MPDKLKQLEQQYLEILMSQNFTESELDYDILKYHVSSLERLDVIGKSSITIFDLFKKEHIYISAKFEVMFRWKVDDIYNDDINFFQSHIHPEDYLKLMGSGIYFLKLGLSLPREQGRDFKLVNTYRVLNGEGFYVNVIEQHWALEFDKRGNVWLALSIIDISPDQDTANPFNSRAINFKTGEVYKFPPVIKSVKKEALTIREKEILTLLSDGLLSKEIADKLFISVNTVNTHRQHILEKLEADNTREAIKYASKLGLIN
jgi:DNA-binding CsgD family transcriptional regulator